MKKAWTSLGFGLLTMACTTYGSWVAFTSHLDHIVGPLLFLAMLLAVLVLGIPALVLGWPSLQRGKKGRSAAVAGVLLGLLSIVVFVLAFVLLPWD